MFPWRSARTLGRSWPSAKEIGLAIGFVVLVVLASLPGFREGFTLLPPANWIVWAVVLLLVAGALALSSSPLRLAVLFGALLVDHYVNLLL